MMEKIWQNLIKTPRGETTLRMNLKKAYIFQDLNASELSLIENVVHLRNYRTAETIFRQGEVGLGMYIIAKGDVNILAEEDNLETRQTKMVPVAQLHEEDFFGDLALVEKNGRRTATAIAHGDCSLIGFFQSDLLELTERNPTAGVKILLRLGEILGIRLIETTAQLSKQAREYNKVKL